MRSKLISIIVVVKNDPKLPDLIDRLLTTPKDIEIIIVDASDQSSMSSAYKHNRVRWFFYDQKGKGRTIVQQRNFGLKKSRGSVIVFIDADCEPSPNWIQSITEPIISKRESVTTGPIIIKGQTTRSNTKKYVRYAGNANIAFSREVMHKVGLYDEEMEVAQDYEYCIRIRENGYRIAFIAQAVVFHPQDSFKKDISKGIIYGEGGVKLYFKHPSEVGLHPHFIYISFYGAYILFLPITILFPYYPLIILIPAVVRLPRSPIKEIINLSSGVGVLIACAKQLRQLV